ncbi:hypothetical protein RJZ56_002403 [Blastomyces dermatitidis]|uniref:Uncharacterized protein n=2 Tax=Blastomyces TaxID=229219 RepID=A0A179UMZ3_BLAGS|nr:uncharacterized protein BDBG_04428 [Blastomyces gilchristii SLH14081]XP_045272726.1 uncharacterized protein BDCG_08109 [Blastomyces dermatitidis ER-3]EEQ84840.2 hypothetical protein BDCG_08109 [Blastomyces dermatitidis ER-3]OAT08487.1 hypothetical protein BDBG_04428 [Blastomyces gilchristii SLH14081]
MQLRTCWNPSVQTVILAPTRDEFVTGFSHENNVKTTLANGQRHQALPSGVASKACHTELTDTDRNRTPAKFEILSPMYGEQLARGMVIDTQQLAVR